MHIELVAIGTEVVTGSTINSNLAYISKRLLEEGFITNRHHALHDNPSALKKELKEIMDRSDIVITTGGLGPTHDDVTREIIADLFESNFRYDDEVATDLSKRYKNLTSLNDQATVPSKAKVLLNTIGTAPGFIFEDNNKCMICLPGVPSEMRMMFEKSVLNYLHQTQPNKIIFKKSFHLFETSETEVDPTLREIKLKFPEMQCGIYPKLGMLTVQLSSEEENKINISSDLLKVKFGARFFPSISGTIEEAVHNLFIEKNWKLAVAESCTGGTIASILTRIPEASKYFLGSLVVYSNEWKNNFLDVPEKMIDKYGAVSEEVVTEMAKNLIFKTKSDFAIAVSGIAGPSGGTVAKPVGTICGAIGEKSGTIHTFTFTRRGNRETIIEGTSNIMLGRLYFMAREHA